MIHRRVPLGLAVASALSILTYCGRASAIAPTLVGGCQIIDTPGFYEVESAINGASTVGPCLDITAAGVTLSLENGGLTGDGLHGTGILIAGKNVFIDGDDGNITDFGIGIEDDGDNAMVENFGLQNSSDTGLYVNGANGSTFGNFGTGAAANHGIHLRRAKHNVFHNVGVSKNGKLGIWDDQSTNNVFNNFQANANGIAGVYFGCSSTGPAGSVCGAFNSDTNVVFSAGADSNGAYGIAIDQDSQGNVISGAEQSKNPTDDAYDGNTNCGTNLWFNQNHPTSNNVGCTNE